MFQYRSYDLKKSNIIVGTSFLVVTQAYAPNDKGRVLHGNHVASSHGGVAPWCVTHGEPSYHLCRCKAKGCLYKGTLGKEVVHIDK